MKLIEARQADRDRPADDQPGGADPGVEGDDTLQVYLRANGKADEEPPRSGLEHRSSGRWGLPTIQGTEAVALGEVERGDPLEDVAAIPPPAAATPRSTSFWYSWVTVQ